MDKADAGHVKFFEKFFKKVNYFEKWVYIKRVIILVYIKKCIVNPIPLGQHHCPSSPHELSYVPIHKQTYNVLLEEKTSIASWSF
jgi:hypothetical protein